MQVADSTGSKAFLCATINAQHEPEKAVKCCFSSHQCDAIGCLTHCVLKILVFFRCTI